MFENWARNKLQGRQVVGTGTGCISTKTFVQSAACALVLGPIMWALHGEYTLTEFLWCFGLAALAPIFVDAIRPVIYVR